MISRFRSPRFVGVVSCAAALLSAIAGCQPGTAKPPLAAIETKSGAEGVLKQMVEAYAKAGTYEDAGELRLAAAQRPGEELQEMQPQAFSVGFERPNKIRVQSLEGSVVADGTKLQAFIEPLEGQILSLPCPPKLTVDDIVPDKMLAEAMRGQIDARLPQLPLLLEADPLKALVEGGGAPTLLADTTLRDEKCHRVSIPSPDGKTVLWISADDHLLRKIEFPTDGLKKKFSLAGFNMWAEFKGAKANGKIDPEAFTIKIPEGAKLLKRFLPPPPAAPSPLLGQAAPDFSFIDLKGGTVNRDSLKNHVVVLDLWATWCGWCFEGFPNLQKVYESYKDNDKVSILAVNRDEPTVSDAKLEQVFQKSKLTIPIVRDQQLTTDEAFKVQGLPTMVVLGADGTVQDIHIGYDAMLAETLPKKIERLLAGENIANDELEKYEQARKAYEKLLSEALADGSSPAPEQTSAAK